MLDLNSLALQDFTTLQVRNPVTDLPLFADTENTKPVEIDIASKSSPQYKKQIAIWTKKVERKRDKKLDAEESRESGFDLLAAVCLRSRNLVVNGVEPKTFEDFREIIANPQFAWLKDQIDEVLGDYSLFIKQSLTD